MMFFYDAHYVLHTLNGIAIFFLSQSIVTSPFVFE